MLSFRLYILILLGGTQSLLLRNIQRRRKIALAVSSSSRSPFSQTATSPGNKTSAPVYITIGPPCCGKTEALRACLLAEGYNPDDAFTNEVTLDEQSAPYQRVPLAGFLFPTSRLPDDIGNQLLLSGSTVRERLLDPAYDATDQELRNILLRIAGRITADEFEQRSLELARQAGDHVEFFRKRRLDIAQELSEAVEQVAVQAVSEVICQMQLQHTADVADEDLPYEETRNDDSQSNSLLNSTIALNATQSHLLSARELIKTPFVDLFVPHAIFRGGMDRAQNTLTEMLFQKHPSEPVAWGNTNTRPVEYAPALAAAQSANRPVQFVAWGTRRLPRVSRQELLRRNVAGFRRCGRYIPAGAVGATLGRIESLMKEAERIAAGLEQVSYDVGTKDWEDHKMNMALASLAGFLMDENGRVTRVDEPRRLKIKSSANKK